MAITRHCYSLLIYGFCLFIFSLTALLQGSFGLSVDPRAPGAASGSSGEGEAHWADGASNYVHMGQDPRPAAVDGSPVLDTKLKVDASDGEILPQLVGSDVVIKRHLLWLGFGEKEKAEQEVQNEEGKAKQAEGGGLDQVVVDGGTDNQEKPQGGNEDLFDDIALDDRDHIWHDDDHDDDHDNTAGAQDGDFGQQEEDDDHYGDDFHDDDDDDDDDIIYTHGRIVEEAEDLLDEYQRKSLDLKEDLTDDEGRERAAAKLEGDIDSEINHLLQRAKDKHGAYHAEDDGDDEPGFMERMMYAKEAVKKRVKDVLTGHNIHFDSDDL